LSQEEAEWVLNPQRYFIQGTGSIAADSLVHGEIRVVGNREKPTMEGRRKLEDLVPEGFTQFQTIRRRSEIGRLHSSGRACPLDFVALRLQQVF
jgi:hypothetical protein